MSVPQSERRQSLVEYTVILQNTEIFLLTQGMIKDWYYPLLSEKLVDISIEAYNQATKLYEMTKGTVRGNNANIKKTAKKAMWAIRELAAQLNILVMLRMEENLPVKKIIAIVEDLKKAFDLIKEQLDKLH